MSGDEAAFEAIFHANHIAVYRYVLRRVEQSGVEDVVGETFLVAWRRYGLLDGPPLPWLLGIARRVSANHLRSSARRSALAERLAAEPPVAVREPDASLTDRPLLAALSTLGDSDREALLLVAWDGLSNREASSVLGCSAGAFAVRLHRARRRLARALPSGAAELTFNESSAIGGADIADGLSPSNEPQGGIVHELP